MSSGARLLGWAPTLVAGLLALPVLAGLVGTLAPALAGAGAFRELGAWPGLTQAALLSLTTGLASTALSLGFCLLILACLAERPLFRWLRRALAPLLALPHAAAALGLAFLIAPSGWIARVLSPWATGWQVPPDLLILNDPYGLALVAGLVLKETPFLLLMALAALPGLGAQAALRQARVMGYGDVAGFALAVWPRLYPALRLPVLAVLAYGMTSVDMALVLGPVLPPLLAVQITDWMGEPGQGRIALAGAGAALQLVLVALALGLWRGGEALARHLARALAFRGRRLRGLDALAPVMAVAAPGLGLVLVAAVLALALWSVAGLWPFPKALPETLSLDVWQRALPVLGGLSLTTLALAGAAAVLAAGLSLAVLQAEYLLARAPLPPVLLYLPLILPQVCFLPGLQVLALKAGLNGGAGVVLAAHLVFMLPYVHVTLAGPFRAWDGRVATVAATLGAGPGRIFWRLRLPMLAAALAGALAVGLAVSVGQYLPTLMLGGGRVATLTTEALALASGGNRRLTAALAALQTLWPMLGFALALGLPPLLGRLWMRRGVR